MVGVSVRREQGCKAITTVGRCAGFGWDSVNAKVKLECWERAIKELWEPLILMQLMGGQNSARGVSPWRMPWP